MGDTLDRAAPEGALSPLAPGELIGIRHGDLEVDVAPAAGGRLAQIRCAGQDWLLPYGAEHAAMIGWGCYPMLPWAGRLRDASFRFDGKRYRVRANMGPHAIHGVGFGLPWDVVEHGDRRIELGLRLPEDGRWPFGGRARHRIEIESAARLRLSLTVTAGSRAMPVTLGWHPWFLKPDAVDFQPQRIYPRDAAGIATLPLAPPPEGPWDDCFVNDRPVLLQRAGRQLRLTSSCREWVVFDMLTDASCFEPQSGPPNAFNLAPVRLEPRQSLAVSFLLEWR